MKNRRLAVEGLDVEAFGVWADPARRRRLRDRRRGDDLRWGLHGSDGPAAPVAKLKSLRGQARVIGKPILGLPDTRFNESHFWLGCPTASPSVHRFTLVGREEHGMRNGTPRRPRREKNPQPTV